MKIADIRTIPLALPYEAGPSRARVPGRDWATLSVLLVRVETDEGHVGYGEAFSYSCLPAVQAAVEQMVAPYAIGRDAADIAALMTDLQKTLHLFGRYGITLFALSGLDIALWDIAGKAAGLPLHRLLGGGGARPLPAYASLLRYGDPAAVAERAGQSAAEGYRYVKLHEIEEPMVRAAREAIGGDVHLMVDTNCPWTPAEARARALGMRQHDLYWLEEPIFPPEDFAALAALRAETGVPIAAGENACTAYEFRKMFAAGAVNYAQPSVTKVGGVTEILRVAALARAHATAMVPHSPYFGPGFLATLHVAASLPEPTLIERYHAHLKGSLYGDLVEPVDGAFHAPDVPGVGPEPDAAVLKELAA